MSPFSTPCMLSSESKYENTCPGTCIGTEATVFTTQGRLCGLLSSAPQPMTLTKHIQQLMTVKTTCHQISSFLLLQMSAWPPLCLHQDAQSLSNTVFEISSFIAIALHRQRQTYIKLVMFPKYCSKNLLGGHRTNEDTAVTAFFQLFIIRYVSLSSIS